MARGPQRLPDVLFRRVGDQIVALNPNTQKVHALEPLAARIFEACDGTVDVKGLAESMDAPAATVTEILARLADSGMIRGVDRRFTRRTALAGGAGVGAGFVASIILPTPAMAASGEAKPPGGPGPDQDDHRVPSAETTIAQSSVEPDGGVEPASSSEKPASPSHKGLAFTGMNVTETAGVAAGAIAAGAAIVAGSRKKSKT